MRPSVLIVEDSRPMREMLRILLAETVDVVGECDDGAEALNAYTRLRPDWVLMDIEMKEVDGIAATRQIIASYPKAQVMIVSDYDDPELRRAAVKAGAARYVIKENLPFILDILTS